MLAAADARQLPDTLRAAALSADTSVRATAVRALGFIEHDAALPLLELALADREPGIRLDAARGLARSAQGSAREGMLLGAYAAAPTAAERVALLGLLADTQPSAAQPWLGRPLRSDEPAEQAAACLAVARLAGRGHAPTNEDMARVLELVEQGAASVRSACASVLSESVARETMRGSGDGDRAMRALAALARSSESEGALLATQALAEAGNDAVRELTELLGSTSPRIALESVRGLRGKINPADLATAVDRELAQRRPNARSARAGVLIELLDALGQHPDSPQAAAVAERALRATSVDLPVVADEPARLERALLHCASARLADAVRRWPKDLLTCGHGRMPEPLRGVWLAEGFARADGSDDLRAAQLARLFAKGPASVQVAIIGASSTLPVKLASELLRSGLRDRDPAVLAAAARAVATRPELRADASEGRVHVSDLVEAAPRAVAHPEAATAWLLAVRALARAPAAPIKSAPGSRQNSPLAPDGSVQGPEDARVSSIPEPLIERVTQLARHPALAVRGPAAALLLEWDAPLPDDVAPVDAPLAADRMPKAGASFHVKLETTAGAIELELDTRRTPVAAVRFVELVRQGALDGLPVAQIMLGRAAGFQPREGSALRHEAVADSAERGSVLLQDHGRDALGPGFALLLARAPALDRRAVVIGRVTRGLEVADALLPIDAIQEARVVTEPR